MKIKDKFHYGFVLLNPNLLLTFDNINKMLIFLQPFSWFFPRFFLQPFPLVVLVQLFSQERSLSSLDSDQHSCHSDRVPRFADRFYHKLRRPIDYYINLQ